MENHNNQSSFEAKLYEVLVQNYLIKYKIETRQGDIKVIAPTEMKEQYDVKMGTFHHNSKGWANLAWLFSLRSSTSYLEIGHVQQISYS